MRVRIMTIERGKIKQIIFSAAIEAAHQTEQTADADGNIRISFLPHPLRNLSKPSDRTGNVSSRINRTTFDTI